jgi:uncharacterized membrane protein
MYLNCIHIFIKGKMTTPIIMLVLMMGPYLMVAAWNALLKRRFNLHSAAVIGLGILFIFTGVGHFAQTAGMVQMLPSWVPEHQFLVYASGILEFAIAIGFFIPALRRNTGFLAVVVLVLFFPLNIYAALTYVPMGGHAWGPVYLLIRAPLQAVIVIWVYWHAIRRPARNLVQDGPST